MSTSRQDRDFRAKRDELLDALERGGMSRPEAARKLSYFVRRVERRGILYGIKKARQFESTGG